MMKGIKIAGVVFLMLLMTGIAYLYWTAIFGAYNPDLMSQYKDDHLAHMIGIGIIGTMIYAILMLICCAWISDIKDK